MIYQWVNIIYQYDIPWIWYAMNMIYNEYDIPWIWYSNEWILIIYIMKNVFLKNIPRLCLDLSMVSYEKREKA